MNQRSDSRSSRRYDSGPCELGHGRNHRWEVRVLRRFMCTRRNGSATRLVVSAWLAAGIHGVASAGPNEGGVLVVHAQKSQVMTVGDPAECGVLEFETCEEIVARVDGENPVRFSIFAVFPEGSSPRVAGAIFGMEYEPSIFIADYRACGDYALPTDEWPASGEGIAITWLSAQTTRMLEMCSFVGYRDGGPGALSTRSHPIQGAGFVDDSPIGPFDEVVGFGSLGFGIDGSFDCSAAACCTASGCQLLPESECSGDYLGVGVTCSGNPCRVGACCYTDGSCAEVTRWECERDQGTSQGAGSTCSPELCVPIPAIESSWGQIRVKFRFQ